ASARRRRRREHDHAPGRLSGPAMAADFLLYSANGYTGSLIARAAAAAGSRPRLAGRNAAAVAALATELELEHAVFALEDEAHLPIAAQHPPWVDARGRRRSPTMSRGTAATLVQAQLDRGAVRRGGRLVAIPLAAGLRWLDLGAGPTTAALFPLGELAALHRST